MCNIKAGGKLRCDGGGGGGGSYGPKQLRLQMKLFVVEVGLLLLLLLLMPVVWALRVVGVAGGNYVQQSCRKRGKSIKASICIHGKCRKNTLRSSRANIFCSKKLKAAVKMIFPSFHLNNKLGKHKQLGI